MPPDSQFSFQHDRFVVWLLLLLLCVLYLPFLHSPLIFDDVPFFDTTIITYAEAPFLLNFRWFPYTTFGVTWVFCAENPIVFRLENLLLHALNVLLLLLVLRLWIALFLVEPARQKLANGGAWLGALVFALHPLAVYGVGYLVERSILMATFFSLIMQLAYFRGLLEGRKRFIALAVAAYFLAVFSKEHSLLVPAILLPLTWILRTQIKAPKSTLYLAWLGFAGIALLVVLRAKGVLGQVYEVDAADMLGQEQLLKGVHGLHLLSALTQAGLFFKYLALMLLPNPAWMSIDMREAFLLNWQDWRNWLGTLAFASYGMVALGCLLCGKQRVALFGLALLYPWLLFFTEFSTIRVQEIFVLYRAYLWLPGVMLLLPLLASFVPEKKIVWLGALLALLLLPLAWNRLWVMADNYRLWDDAVTLLQGKNRLGAQRVYYGRAYALAEKKNWDAAIVDFNQSLTIDPSKALVYLNLSAAYYNSKRYEEALQVIEKLLKRETNNAQAIYNKGILLGLLHQPEEEFKWIQRSCDLGSVIACATLSIKKLRRDTMGH